MIMHAAPCKAYHKRNTWQSQNSTPDPRQDNYGSAYYCQEAEQTSRHTRSVHLINMTSEHHVPNTLAPTQHAPHHTPAQATASTISALLLQCPI
jgi:hypothetical protein